MGIKRSPITSHFTSVFFHLFSFPVPCMHAEHHWNGWHGWWWDLSVCQQDRSVLCVHCWLRTEISWMLWTFSFTIFMDLNKFQFDMRWMDIIINTHERDQQAKLHILLWDQNNNAYLKKWMCIHANTQIQTNPPFWYVTRDTVGNSQDGDQAYYIM